VVSYPDSELGEKGSVRPQGLGRLIGQVPDIQILVAYIAYKILYFLIQVMSVGYYVMTAIPHMFCCDERISDRKTAVR
jgi:hypothetical protein